MKPCSTKSRGLVLFDVDGRRISLDPQTGVVTVATMSP